MKRNTKRFLALGLAILMAGSPVAHVQAEEGEPVETLEQTELMEISVLDETAVEEETDVKEETLQEEVAEGEIPEEETVQEENGNDFEFHLKMSVQKFRQNRLRFLTELCSSRSLLDRWMGLKKL